MMLDGLKWIFFDMGSTLIDDSESYPVWFQNVSDAVGGAVSAEEIRREYLAGMARYAATVVGQVKPYGFTGNTTIHLYPHTLERPYPQAKPLLERLSKTYRLGVIANQSPGAEERLKRHELLPYFAFVLGSADVGLHKPDPRIFLLALEKAGCEPGEAMMIGDRPDNDIYPAKLLGMRTVRIRQGAAACQEPRSPEYEADATVDNLDELGEVLR